ncbi:hypothetical protein LDO31_02080 [Luteimonas sp. XNQY3]|nr:hypothetical protein [Luteimonas sp. XNQY3]MCD9005040.1 hypothetical protein [Luteimonas sp. XNQY3]
MHIDSDGSIPLSKYSLPSASWQRRIRHLSLAALLTGLLSVGHTTAQEAEQPAAAQAVAPNNPGRNGKVCRSEDVTGSRMRKRVCYTPEQWDARQRAAREAVRNLDNRPVGKIGEG